MSKQRVQEQRHFTVAEKIKYYTDRMNDVNVSAGQRRWAEDRLFNLRKTLEFRKPTETVSLCDCPLPAKPVPKKTTEPPKIDCSSPSYELACKQFEERKAAHNSRYNIDDYSSGYVRAAGDYELYRIADRSEDKKLVNSVRETIKQTQDAMRELANRELYPESPDDPFGYRNKEIIEARGYMKGLGDAAKVRKGVLLD